MESSKAPRPVLPPDWYRVQRQLGGVGGLRREALEPDLSAADAGTGRGQATCPLRFRRPAASLSPCLSASVPTLPPPSSLSLSCASCSSPPPSSPLRSCRPTTSVCTPFPGPDCWPLLLPPLWGGTSDRSAVGRARCWPHRLRLRGRGLWPSSIGACPLPPVGRGARHGPGHRPPPA